MGFGPWGFKSLRPHFQESIRPWRKKASDGAVKFRRAMPVSAVRLVLGITAVLVTASPAAALASSPATVRPSSRVISAKVTGDTVHFVVEVSFATPGDSPAAKACKGKVEISKAAKGHRKSPHWTGPLTPNGDICRAKVSGKLPAELFDRKVPFTVAFDGNGVVAPFSKPAGLKLSPPGGSGKVKGPPAPSPPAPLPPGDVAPIPAYTAADGHWEGQSTGGGVFISFTVEGGVIRTHFSSTGNMTLKCDTEDGSAKESLLLVGVDFRDEIGLDAGGELFRPLRPRVRKRIPRNHPP